MLQFTCFFSGKSKYFSKCAGVKHFTDIMYVCGGATQWGKGNM